MKPTHRVRILKSAEVSESLARYIADLSSAAESKGRPFCIGFSGGSLPKLACSAITSAKYESTINWGNWKIFFVDERCVPLDHADSNCRLVKQELLNKLNGKLAESQLFTYDPESSTPAEAATRYAEEIRKIVPLEGNGFPSFDLLLLGMGEDGHTASLFPGHELLHEKTKIVASITDSPKPPPERITLTYPVIHAASEVAVVAAGAGKAELLVRVLAEPGDAQQPKYPVQGAWSATGELKFVPNLLSANHSASQGVLHRGT